VHPESARSARKHTQGPPADGSREAVITSPGDDGKAVASTSPPRKDLDPVDSGLPGTPHIGGFANAPRA